MSHAVCACSVSRCRSSTTPMPCSRRSPSTHSTTPMPATTGSLRSGRGRTRFGPGSATPRCNARSSSTKTRRVAHDHPMIEIGLVGCGHIGRLHSYVIRRLVDAGLVDARLTATYDLDPERAGSTAAHHGARPARSIEDLVQSVDVVWVCTW